MKLYSKTLSLSLVVMSMLTSCGHDARTYTLDLDIKGLPDSTKIYIRPVTHIRETENLNEAYIVDGKARLVGSVEGPTGAYLRIENGNGWLPFMLENSNITISGNITGEASQRDSTYTNYDFSDLNVKGSVNTPRFQHIHYVRDSIFDLIGENRRTHADMLAQYTHARTNKNKAVIDSIEASDEYLVYSNFEKNAHQLVDSLYANLIHEGNDSFWGPMTMLSLYVYFVPSMRQIYEDFSDEAKASVYGQEIKNELYPVGRPGDKLKNFETVNSFGDSVSMEEIAKQHKYTLIDFWASWCGPCRREIPNLRKIYDNHKDNGFNILSVSIDNEDDAWRTALEQENLPWINCRDTEGDIAKSYGVKSIPMLVVVDNEGKLVIENMRGEELENKIAELLSQE